jgi:hypothetical protein
VDGWLSTQLWWTQMPSCKTNGPNLSWLHYSIWNLHGCIKQTNWISNSTKQMTLGILQPQTYHSHCQNSPRILHYPPWSHCQHLYGSQKTLPLQTSILIMSATGEWLLKNMDQKLYTFLECTTLLPIS